MLVENDRKKYEIKENQKPLESNVRFRTAIEKVLQMIGSDIFGKKAGESRLLKDAIWYEFFDPMHRRPSALRPFFNNGKKNFKPKLISGNS